MASEDQHWKLTSRVHTHKYIHTKISVTVYKMAHTPQSDLIFFFFMLFTLKSCH